MRASRDLRPRLVYRLGGLCLACQLVAPHSGASAELGPPNYKALLIGIDDYQEGSGWSDLSAPVKDVDGLKKILEEKYHFQSVKVLRNKEATRAGMAEALARFLESARESDALLIYFGGHGAERLGTYYWVPSDGTQGVHSTAYPTDPLLTMMRSSRARQVLLVSDSCFAGMILRPRTGPPPAEGPPTPDKQLQEALSLTSRQVFVSGERTTVFDEVRVKSTGVVRYNGHSPFAAHFLAALEQNSFLYLGIDDIERKIANPLFNETAQRVDVRPTRFEDKGTFVFVNAKPGGSRPPVAVEGKARGGGGVSESVTLQVTSNLKGTLKVNEREVKGPVQSSWQVDVPEGVVSLELVTACQKVSKAVVVEEKSLGNTQRVTLDGTLADELCIPLPGVDKPLYWVSVPAGEFTMGSNEGSDDEKPPHKVKLSAFKLSKTEVTVAQYDACVQAKKCTEPTKGDKDNFCNWKVAGRENHPINCVDWEQAKAFTGWLSGVTGQDVRLPSEAQWEYAARGPEGRKYPWGSADPTQELANYGNNVGSTTPVGEYPKGASWAGALDMAGNVWEWTEDCWHEGYTKAPEDGSVWTTGCTAPSIQPTIVGVPLNFRVLRGGSWDYGPGWLRGANRVWWRAGVRLWYGGFRPVLLAPPGGDN